MTQQFISNATWVCFDCREAMRRPTYYLETVSCPQCGVPTRCIGTRLRIPSKGDRRGWKVLRALFRKQRIAAAELASRMRVRRRHQLERQIVLMEARPWSEGRNQFIDRLREQLAST